MSPPPPTTADADAARRTAAAILGEGRFHNPSVPRPLHGVLHDLGVVLQSIGHAVSHVVDRVGKLFPGGTLAVWTVLGLALSLIPLLLIRFPESLRRQVEAEMIERRALAAAREEQSV